MGNLAIVDSRARIEVFLSAPEISNKVVPGFTLQHQKSTAPLPFPIRTSVGFLLTAKSGKDLICSLPDRFILLLMDCLQDSNCLAVILALCCESKRKTPSFKVSIKRTFFLLVLIVPFWYLRYFVFFWF